MESHDARRTFVFHAVDGEHVSLEVRVLAESGVAHIALERALACVRARVTLEIIVSLKATATFGALQPSLLFQGLHAKEGKDRNNV